MTALCLVIILTDDAMKHKCMWPLTLSKSHTIHRHLFSEFSPFCSLVKGKGKQGRMKGLIMAQWTNLNQNNRSVLAHWYSVLWKKTGPILLALVGLTAGRQVDKIRVSFEYLKIFYMLNYSGFYFVLYHYNVTTVLEMHFSRLLSSEAYF